jgi:p-cumate 2,3-dioxygenase beta subunit
MTATAYRDLSREALESFFYREALLLDEWQLEAWLGLFAPEGRYQIPSTDEPDREPWESLYLIDDDHVRLASRIHQLLGKTAFAEQPRSRTRHNLSNLLFEPLPDGDLRVRANFTVYRFRHEQMYTFVGRYDHRLTLVGGELRFKLRKAILDHEALRPHAKISIII